MGPPVGSGAYMIFSETFETALAYAKAALDHLVERAVPPTPNNFMVWYVYSSGGSLELKREMDRIIEHNEPFTPERSLDLFERYFGTVAETQALRETSQRLESAVAQLVGFLSKAGVNTAHYGETLRSASGQLRDSNKIEDIRSVVASVLAETKKMAEQHRQLQYELTSSAREMSQLRENIVSARREAQTDALTGIANRKFFEQRIEENVRDAMRTGDDLCLLMLDIDHFKKFNDTYGHQLGDQVLRLVAKTFTECIKGRDTAARYGGEEFVVLLPHTSVANAVKLADHLRLTVAGKMIVNRQTGKSLGQITLSIGVAQYRANEPVAKFIQRADKALYKAKGSGRNRVVAEDNSSASAAA
jgi:diguanylate cyclase